MDQPWRAGKIHARHFNQDMTTRQESRTVGEPLPPGQQAHSYSPFSQMRGEQSVGVPVEPPLTRLTLQDFLDLGLAALPRCRQPFTTWTSSSCRNSSRSTTPIAPG